MFGFLTINKNINKQSLNIYKQHFCGLCHTLGKNYGLLSRFFTNYDATLLYILSNAQLKEKIIPEKIKCPLRFNKIDAILNPASAAFSAAISIVLVYEKMLDDDYDEKQEYPAIIKNFVVKQYAKAKENLSNLGFSVEFIHELMQTQREVEKRTDLSINELCEPTAVMMKEIFKFTTLFTSSPNSPSPARGEGWGEVGVKEDKACPERSRRGEGESKLAVVGYNLGKLIYLLDSIFDYSQDIKFNKFNPLSACYPETNGSKYFNQLPPSVINELKQLSSEALAEIKNNLDNIETLMLYNNPKNDENNPPLPPFNKGGMGGFSWEILENILVSGLSSKFTDIFGMFHNKCHYEKRSDEVIPKIQIASHPLAMTYETCHIFANKDMKKQTLFKPAMLEIPLLTSCFSLIPQKAYAANGNVTNICCNYIISIGLLLFIFYFVFTKFFGVRRCCCCSNDKEHNCFQINCCNC